MKLSNGIIEIEISEHGAELTSIKKQGTEYLWQANPEYWKRHSPVLFPIVGSVWNGEYRSSGKTYKLGQHGFARDMDFTLVGTTANSILYALESSAATKEKYPYDFRLEIGYTINDNEVEVLWRVKNPSKSPMAFQIGAHPAFYWPMLSDISRDDLPAMEAKLQTTNKRGYFTFGSKEKAVFTNTILGDKGCAKVGENTLIVTNHKGQLPLTTDTFDHDALIFEDSQVNQVTLCDQAGLPYITLKFKAPLVGLWSPPKKNAPFVCIEPWFGRCDQVGYEGRYEDKDWIQSLGAEQTFEARYTIAIEQ